MFLSRVTSQLKNGLYAAQRGAAELRCLEKAKQFVRSAETRFRPTVAEKARDGFFDRL